MIAHSTGHSGQGCAVHPGVGLFIVHDFQVTTRQTVLDLIDALPAIFLRQIARR
jgi:hypothetical protein